MTTTTGISSPAGGSEDPATAAAPETTTTTAATNEGSSPAPESGSATKKKRGAGDDWAKSKDDVEDGDSDDMAEEGTGSGEFRRADAETLSKRRIVKARRPPGMEGGGDGSPAAAAAAAAAGGNDKPAVANPFAVISLTGAKPAAAAGGGGGGVFGSGFPKMNAASILGASGGGGGWGSTAAKEGDRVRPGTGPGLGSAPFGFAAYKLNPFQSAAPSAGTGASSSSFVSSPSKRKPPSELVGASGASSQSQFGKPAIASQGGEDEEEGGGVEGGGSPLGGGGEEDLEAEPNVTFDVPKVQGLKDASYRPLTGEEGETCVLQLRSKLYRLTEVKRKEDSAAGGGGGGGGGGGASSSSPAPRRDWVETGVGQAKVLVPQSRDGSSSAPARVVMRREPGTSVLINTLLKEPVGVAKHADKALRLTCLDENGVPSTFLFRFKTTDEMEQMLGEIEGQLAIAAGPGTEAGAGGEAAEGKKEGEAEAV